ncbi:MAG: hypothetical protein ACOX8N_00255 [Christensenellales bacterium]|jgi:hypothetical protein
MIICEECGARNRNDAYVCAECEASLLHLEPVPDDEPAPAKRKRPLFGRRKQQRESYDEPEYAYDAGEDSPEPADMEQDEPEEAEPVRRGVFARRKPQMVVSDEQEHTDDTIAAEDMPETADGAQGGLAYQDEPEQDGGLRFVFEEAADEPAPAVESEPQEYTAAAEESEPDTAPAAEEQPDLAAAQDEMPPESIEIELPGYAEEEEAPRHAETRADRSREVRVRVARVRADRYRRAEEPVPSRIPVDLDDEEHDDEPDEPDRMTRGMIAAIVTVASLLVITLVVLGVLLLGRGRSVPAAATTEPPAATVTAEMPNPSPEATPEPPIPTTNPE